MVCLWEGQEREGREAEVKRRRKGRTELKGITGEGRKGKVKVG